MDRVRFREQLLRDRRHRDVLAVGVKRVRGKRSVARETETENVFNLGHRIQREMFGVSSWRGEFAVLG
jgi:hypothetical protein